MQIKYPRSFQNTLDWVLNHMQYLHLFPATVVCQLWTETRNSSFKKISVTESMFTFTETPERNSIRKQLLCTSVLLLPLLLTASPLPLLCLASQCFPVARHLKQMHSASPHADTHTSKPAFPSNNSNPWTAAATISPSILGNQSGLTCQAAGTARWLLKPQPGSGFWTPLVVTGRKCGALVGARQ